MYLPKGILLKIQTMAPEISKQTMAVKGIPILGCHMAP